MAIDRVQIENNRLVVWENGQRRNAGQFTPPRPVIVSGGRPRGDGGAGGVSPFYDEILTGTAQTVGAVTVDVITIPVALNESIAVSFEVYGISLSDNDETFSKLITGFRNVAGVVTMVDNSVDEYARISDDPGVGGEADVLGTDGLLQVLGRATETYNWKMTAGILRFVP